MYGKSANGLSRLNSTVRSSTALVPPGDSTPPSCERAPEPLSGSRTRSMLVTTSSAPKGLPSLNVTPERSLKVQTSTAVVRRPALGELGPQRVVVVEVDEVLEELVHEDDAALVVDGDRVGIGDRRGADPLEVAADDGLGRAGRARRCRGAGLVAAAGCQQLAGGRQREAEHRRTHQHLTPGHLALEDLLDQVLTVLPLELRDAISILPLTQSCVNHRSGDCPAAGPPPIDCGSPYTRSLDSKMELTNQLSPAPLYEVQIFSLNACRQHFRRSSPSLRPIEMRQTPAGAVRDSRLESAGMYHARPWYACRPAGAEMPSGTEDLELPVPGVRSGERTAHTGTDEPAVSLARRAPPRPDRGRGPERPRPRPLRARLERAVRRQPHDRSPRPRDADPRGLSLQAPQARHLRGGAAPALQRRQLHAQHDRGRHERRAPKSFLRRPWRRTRRSPSCWASPPPAACTCCSGCGPRWASRSPSRTSSSRPRASPTCWSTTWPDPSGRSCASATTCIPSGRTRAWSPSSWTGSRPRCSASRPGTPPSSSRAPCTTRTVAWWSWHGRVPRRPHRVRGQRAGGGRPDLAPAGGR